VFICLTVTQAHNIPLGDVPLHLAYNIFKVLYTAELTRMVDLSDGWMDGFDLLS